MRTVYRAAGHHTTTRTAVHTDDLPAELAGLPLRPVDDADAEQLQRLIGGIFAEYPGCVLDLPGIDADLRAPASSLREQGGCGWVACDGDRIVASGAVTPATWQGGPAAECKRIYVAASHRRRGLGAALVDLVEQVAVRDHGARAVLLWSDTRFHDAHRMYERLGYVRQPDTRDLHDPSNTTEYQYVRHLDRDVPPPQ